MNYYVYIDESGQFKKGNDKSIVLGVISNKNHNEYAIELEKTALEINKKYDVAFDITKDIHIAPLISPNNYFNNNSNIKLEKQKDRFKKIPENIRLAFAEKVFLKVQELSKAFVVSKVFPKSGIGSQSRYGSCLISCIEESIKYLKTIKDCDNIHIFIDPRGNLKNNNINDNWHSYHEKMAAQLRKDFKKDLNPNQKLEIECNIYNNTKLNPSDIADVACYFTRFRKEVVDSSKIIYALGNKTDKKLLSFSSFINKLILNKEFDTAYRWSENAKDKAKALKAIAEEADDKIKLSACSALLNIGYALIDKRTIQKDALSDAVSLFQNILKFTQSDDPKFKECYLSAVNGLLVSANHSGDKGTQDKVYKLYQNSMEELSHIPYFTRQENILAVRNRAYNNHFNDYRFQEIINDFESVVKMRISQIPENEMDGLTGEMLGTLGQAYAFASKNNAEYVKLADDYFTRSLHHFPVGHKYHKMSINYLTTHHWYHKNIESAIKIFTNNETTDKTPSKLISQIINSKEYNFTTVFDISVLLRLAVAKEQLSIKAIENIDNFLIKCNINSHPYELIYKWLGIAYINNNEYDKAIEQFDKSIALSNTLGFTVQTLSIPVIGLKCIVLQRQKSEDLMQVIEGLKQVTKDLSECSTSFSAYIDEIGGINQMLSDIKADDIKAVAKWLPFAYA